MKRRPILPIRLNLALNARDAIGDGDTATGTISVRLRHAESALGLPEKRRPTHPGPFVVIDVADSGRGIAADVALHLFEPGFTTRPGHGHGLGLPSSAAIVARVGGALLVESAPGQGSTFSVWLPAAKAGENA